MHLIENYSWFSVLSQNICLIFGLFCLIHRQKKGETQGGGRILIKIKSFLKSLTKCPKRGGGQRTVAPLFTPMYVNTRTCVMHPTNKIPLFVRRDSNVQRVTQMLRFQRIETRNVLFFHLLDAACTRMSTSLTSTLSAQKDTIKYGGLYIYLSFFLYPISLARASDMNVNFCLSRKC